MLKGQRLPKKAGVGRKVGSWWFRATLIMEGKTGLVDFFQSSVDMFFHVIVFRWEGLAQRKKCSKTTQIQQSFRFGGLENSIMSWYA